MIIGGPHCGNISFPWTHTSGYMYQDRVVIWTSFDANYCTTLLQCVVRFKENERKNNKMIMTNPHLFPKWVSVCCKRLTLNDPYSALLVSVERDIIRVIVYIVYMYITDRVRVEKGSRTRLSLCYKRHIIKRPAGVALLLIICLSTTHAQKPSRPGWPLINNVIQRLLYWCERIVTWYLYAGRI